MREMTMEETIQVAAGVSDTGAAIALGATLAVIGSIAVGAIGAPVIVGVAAVIGMGAAAATGLGYAYDAYENAVGHGGGSVTPGRTRDIDPPSVDIEG